MQSNDIKCGACGTLFGKEVRFGPDITLTIKNRDLYRHFQGGKVWGPCRGCGADVVWPQSPENKR